jgi:hypothetical protein
MNYYQYAGIVAIAVGLIGAVRFLLLGAPPGFIGIPGLGSMMTLYMYVGVVLVIGVVIYMYGNGLQNKPKVEVKK